MGLVTIMDSVTIMNNCDKLYILDNRPSIMGFIYRLQLLLLILDQLCVIS